MRGKRMREYGYVQAHDLAPWQPGADAYLPDGTPVFNSKRSAQDFYDRRRDMGGPHARVDPDGGPPSAKDIEDAGRARRERRARSKREREKRRANLHRRQSGKINVKLK